MYPNFVTEDGDGWFVYACTSCGTHVRFGPTNVERGTAEYEQEQARSQADLRAKRWSKTQKCPKCQERRRARQTRR